MPCICYENNMHVGSKKLREIQMITDQCDVWILEENMTSLA
jgi:hypothetical protein